MTDDQETGEENNNQQKKIVPLTKSNTSLRFMPPMLIQSSALYIVGGEDVTAMDNKHVSNEGNKDGEE